MKLIAGCLFLLMSFFSVGSAKESYLSPQQIADIFGYQGSLTVEEMGNPTDQNVLSNIRVASTDNAFGPVGIEITKGGAVANTFAQLANLPPQNLPDGSPAPRQSTPVQLSNGVQGYFVLGVSRTGSGIGEVLTSPDKSFDLFISIELPSDNSLLRNDRNKEYFDKFINGNLDQQKAAVADIMGKLYPLAVEEYPKLQSNLTGNSSATSHAASFPPLVTPSGSNPASTTQIPIAPTKQESETLSQVWIYGIVILSLGLFIGAWFLLRPKK
ncbi:MAG: hypothetical protein LV479_03525 [Methylacidiphilales bacterium]|nr:hypothetical protein [Candidatus Methylacidiphilales bacterium]